MAAMRGKGKRKHTEACQNRFMKVQDGKNDEVELEDRALDAMFEAQRWTHDEEDGEHAKRGGLNRLYITITIALCMTIVCIAMNQHFTSMQKEKPSTR